MLPLASITGFLGGGRVAVGLGYTALMLSYHFVCEALTGQTLGKAIMGIRVVDMRGRPLRPAVVAARAVLLLIDSVLIGLISIAATGERQQRLGDLAARTVVAPAEMLFVPARSKRDRLTMWLYPLGWLAPCVLLFLFVPWASAPECNESSLRGEGTCSVGHHVFEVKAAGHPVDMDGFDADLLATRTRTLACGAELVSFQLDLTDTGGSPLQVRSHVGVTLSVLEDTGVQRILPPRGSTKLRTLAPGKSGRVW